MSAETAEICRRAAEIVQKKGLCKGFLFDDEGHVCMWGALHEASVALYGSLNPLFPYGDYGAIHMAIAGRVGGEFSLENFPGAADFNDLPETTETDVAKFLLGVADDLDFA